MPAPADIKELYSELAFDQSRAYLAATTEFHKQYHAKRIMDLGQELEAMLLTFGYFVEA